MALVVEVKGGAAVETIGSTSLVATPLVGRRLNKSNHEQVWAREHQCWIYFTLNYMFVNRDITPYSYTRMPKYLIRGLLTSKFNPLDISYSAGPYTVPGRVRCMCVFCFFVFFLGGGFIGSQEALRRANGHHSALFLPFSEYSLEVVNLFPPSKVPSQLVILNADQGYSVHEPGPLTFPLVLLAPHNILQVWI